MPQNWKTYKLKDILGEKGYIRGPFGSALKRGEMKSEGIPVYEQQQAIYNSRKFRYFIDDKKFEKLKRFQVRTDDLIISCSGTVGRISIIRHDDPKGIISQALLILRPDPELVLPRFLQIFFQSPGGFNKLINASYGSVQANIANRAIVEDIDIILPPLPEQKAIAAILSALDDKIELNLQMNKTLEEMAMTLYKHWFVDFGPFQNGKFVESELGMIPEGWEVKGILEVCDLLSGGTPKTKVPEYWNGDIKWVSAKDIGNGSVYTCQTEKTITELGVEKSSTKILPEDTVILVARGSVGKYGMITESMAMNQSCYGLYSNSSFCQGLVYLTFANMIQQFQQAAYGSVFDTITTSTFKSARIVCAPDDTINEFGKIINPLFISLKDNILENETLSKTRDPLVPKLISGEVRVKQAEEIINELT